MTPPKDSLEERAREIANQALKETLACLHREPFHGLCMEDHANHIEKALVQFAREEVNKALDAYKCRDCENHYCDDYRGES